MKIQCDVCSKKEASIFCVADEASLCDGCDQRVHHANKLASKHERFSLLYPSSSTIPICDICQEKRAVLFCQQDRAILCKDCDHPLHTANEHTQKHNRFLLTGIKLSEIYEAKISSNINDNINGGDTRVPDFKCANNRKPTSVSSSEISTSANGSGHCNTEVISSVNNQLVSGGSTSSISEYLIETLPGWHFEDFLLDSVSTSPFGFSKSNNELEGDEDVLSFLDVENDKKWASSNNSTQYQNLGIWVPQAPAAAAIAPISTTINFGNPGNFHHLGGFVDGTKLQETSVKVNRKLMNKDDGFTVPQIIQSVGSKRTRPFW
uniref:Salt tolerance protein n=1 Tax=Sesuvium portulacastrum TaxID=221166 RepID=A0A2I7ZAP5_SESPO|nr:salt tolerance protein [Sesuvium portulacastrum]